MNISKSKMRHFLIAAGLTVSTFAIAGSGSAMIAHGGDDEKVEKAEKKEKRRIRIVKSGGEPVTVVGTGGRTVIATSHGLAGFEKERKEALEKAQAALGEVTERLKKARNKSEKQALKAAEAGLRAAIESLESQHVRTVIAPSRVEIAKIEADAMVEALEHLHDRESEIYSMRIELKEELAEAREEIAEALGDIDLEIDLDGEVRTLRIESLRSAERSLEVMEQEQLEALRRAEEEIKRERVRIEERIERRKKEAEDDDQ